MGIYIKDMNMPTSCPCELIGDGYDVYCSFAGGVPRYIKEYDECCQNGTKPSWCPLVPVPPHGRLIDVDALTDAIESTDWYHQAPNKEMVHGANSAEHQAWYKEQDIYSALENAPTIIESTIGQLNSDSVVNEAEEGE